MVGEVVVVTVVSSFVDLDTELVGRPLLSPHEVPVSANDNTLPYQRCSCTNPAPQTVSARLSRTAMASNGGSFGDC